MELNETISAALAPLFAAHPLEKAMSQLVVRQGASDTLIGIVENIVADTAIAAKPPLAAGLWLYVDELDRSHAVSQRTKDATGSFWHGIMHRREGDFGNSHYWFDRAGSHPAMADIPGYDGHAFVDEVEARQAHNAERLVAQQRAEWQALFAWCAAP